MSLHTNYMNGLRAKSFSLLKTGHVFSCNLVGAEHAFEGFEKLLGVTIETLLVHGIQHPRSLPARLKQTSIVQGTKIPRCPGLRYLQCLHDFAHGALPDHDYVQDSEPCLRRYRFARPYQFSHVRKAICEYAHMRMSACLHRMTLALALSIVLARISR